MADTVPATPGHIDARHPLPQAVATSTKPTSFDPIRTGVRYLPQHEYIKHNRAVSLEMTKMHKLDLVSVLALPSSMGKPLDVYLSQVATMIQIQFDNAENGCDGQNRARVFNPATATVFFAEYFENAITRLFGYLTSKLIAEHDN